MDISLSIPSDRIANMMVSAIESGDPVTTASRGGWCVSIENRTPGLSAKTKAGWWYAEASYFDGPFKFEVVELDDESTGHETHHLVGPRMVKAGLEVMATKFPSQFAMILANDTDAPCADIFLQCILFGEEKYA
jgi:hypothetical protein